MDNQNTNIKQACNQCALSNLCLPLGLSSDDIHRLDKVIDKRRLVQKGQTLYHKHDKFHAIYAVRSGSFKSVNTDLEGQRHVIGFHLPGELLGLDAIHADHHHTNAIALETSSVCIIPFREISKLAADVPALQKQLFRIMSERLTSEVLFQGDFSSEERLSAFLLSLSSRFKQRGYSPNKFQLSMSRGDIGNYLNMATETVSRVFARFQKDRLLRVERREVELLDLAKLKASARCVSSPIFDTA